MEFQRWLELWARADLSHPVLSTWKLSRLLNYQGEVVQTELHEEQNQLKHYQMLVKAYYLL